MSDSENAGFGKFVPGFEFLQNLVKGASQTLPQMPNLANWVAPSLNVEELDKRIGELKAVHFWLDQNSRALGATIQALEVQKMTLAALQGMNFNLGEVANAFKLKADDTVPGGVQRGAEKVASATQSDPESSAPAAGTAERGDEPDKAAKPAVAGLPGMVDPLQLWGSLTQQFQQIAATAMKDVSRNAAVDATRNMAAGFARDTTSATKKTASGTAKPASRTVAKKTPRKAATARNR